MEILRTIDIDGVEYQLGDKVEAIPDSEIDRILSSMEKIEMITFLATNDVEGEHFEVTCENGMTWEMFANSEYSSGDCIVTIENDEVYADIGMRKGRLWHYDTREFVSKDDAIEANIEYAVE